MIVIVKKLSKVKHPAALVANKNAARTPPTTIRKANKRARCTRPVSMKMHIAAVCADHHQREATRLPNYTCFRTTDTPHCITLVTPGYPPHIDPAVEFFSPRTLHE
uniref:Uncharacterized protein n=1 Tax=Romanomermis culicivorax TaxID=13658 RepID=A0A915IIW4_ROMCU